MRISAAVMAHPARRDRAERLVRALPELSAELALDPDPCGPPTSVRSAAVAWSRAPAGPGHHVVLEDDVSLAPGFARRLVPLVAARPEAAIALFANWSSWTAAMARAAAVAGYRWAPVIDDYMPTQALVLPGRAGRALAEFLRAGHRPEEPGDAATLRFLREAGMETVVAVPNLVEHDGVLSLMGNEGHGQRRSCCFLSADASAPPVDAVRDPPVVPYLSESTGRATLMTTAPAEPRHRRLVLDALGPFAGAAHAAYGLTGLGDGPAFELWLTGAALGATLTSAAALSHPVATRALATVAPGAFGTAVPVRHAVVIGEAVRWGLRELSSAIISDAITVPVRRTPDHRN